MMVSLDSSSLSLITSIHTSTLSPTSPVSKCLIIITHQPHIPPPHAHSVTHSILPSHPKLNPITPFPLVSPPTIILLLFSPPPPLALSPKFSHFFSHLSHRPSPTLRHSAPLNLPPFLTSSVSSSGPPKIC